jgi:hypothetical protein
MAIRQIIHEKIAKKQLSEARWTLVKVKKLKNETGSYFYKTLYNEPHHSLYRKHKKMAEIFIKNISQTKYCS